MRSTPREFPLRIVHSTCPLSRPPGRVWIGRNLTRALPGKAKPVGRVDHTTHLRPQIAAAGARSLACSRPPARQFYVGGGVSVEVAEGGRVGGGRFEILARIGEGAAGVVYEVKDRQSDSRLALKTVRGAGAEALVSLKREFRAAQDLAHPNLVRLDELFEDAGTWFFTMELVDGKDWLAYVRPEGALEVARLRATLGQLVEALGALHAAGMVHRDVKPSNVLVSGDGVVKVLDFGIAAARYRIGSASDGGMVGTLAYMAPEQVLSEEPTPASDFYAVGVMLYQALTGRLPYFDRSGHVAEEKLTGPPTPLKAIAPSAPDDLAALCGALLHLTPSERPTGEAILRALGESVVSGAEALGAGEGFVGRASELYALSQAYDAVLARATVAVLVEGPSGVGKSALVRRFLDGVRADALVLQGRCHEREYVPYKGIDAIVDELAAYLGEADDVFDDMRNPAMRLLPRLFPVLTRVPFFARLGAASSPPAEGDASELRARIFGAFRELVARVTHERTLVLWIDDVQWADGDSLALLSDLLAPPSPPPLLLLYTRRLLDGEMSGADATPIPALPGDPRVVSLAGLSDDELVSLASGLAHDAPIGEAELRILTKESGGHPLFLQELLRRRARGSGGAPLLRLDDALWERILRLEPSERSLVEASAVAGVPTALEVVAEAAGIERRDLARHSAALRGANLVKLSGQERARRIEPYHDRVREAVVSHLDPEKLRAWHQRIARTLEASPDRDVERLAFHCEGAGDAPRAAALFRAAGDRASQAFAFDRAVDLYRRALTLGAPTITRSDARLIELALAEALFDAGRGREAGDVFVALAGAGDDRVALELRLRGARAYFGSGYFNEGIEAIRTVLDAVDISLPEGRIAVLSRMLWYRMRVVVRRFKLAKRDPASVAPREVLRYDVCTSAGFGLGMADTVRGSIFQYLSAKLSLELGDPKRAVRGLSGFALSACTGGVNTARITAEAIAEARKLAKGLDDPYSEALIAGASGFAAFMLENWVEADGHLRRAEELFRSLQGVSFELATARMMHGRTLAQLGRFDALAVYQGPTLRDAIRRNDVYAMNNTRATVSAMVAIAQGDVVTAEAEIAEAERVLASYRYQMQHVYCLLSGCAIDLYRSQPEKVIERLEGHRARLRASLFERVQSIRVALASCRARAHLAFAARSSVGRREHLAEAARCAEVLGAQGLPGAAAHAALTRATVAAIDGKSVAAAEGLRVAIGGFDERSMVLHAAAARYALSTIEGGATGVALKAAALDAMRAQKIAAPETFAAHYAPGFAR